MPRTAEPVPPPPPAGLIPSAESVGSGMIGRWLVDARRSTLRVTVKVGRLIAVSGSFADVFGEVDISDDPLDSRVEVAVGTASLSSGSSRMDALLHGAGIIDSARNPTIDFHSSTVRPSGSAGSWLLDGLLATSSALLDVTLAMPDPVALDGQLVCWATGVLPSGEAVRLLSQPGVERILGPTMRLDLTLVATRA